MKGKRKGLKRKAGLFSEGVSLTSEMTCVVVVCIFVMHTEQFTGGGISGSMGNSGALFWGGKIAHSNQYQGRKYDGYDTG